MLLLSHEFEMEVTAFLQVPLRGAERLHSKYVVSLWERDWRKRSLGSGHHFFILHLSYAITALLFTS